MKRYVSFFIALIGAISANAQLDKELTNLSTNLEEIGVLKNLTSKEIESSKLGIGFETLDRKVFEPSHFYENVGKTGVKWARCQTGWARTETVKGKYDFAWLDDVVDNLLKRGIQPWFNVGYGNPVYMGEVKGNPTAVGHIPLYYGKECEQAWRNYVKALAAHFKGRVKHFEIWNEPEIKQFWQPKGADPLEYARLIEITAKEIKSVYPEAIIGACSAGVYTGKYVEALMATDTAKTLDFYSVHNYCLMPEVNFPNYIQSLRALMQKNGVKAQLWQGETGFPSYAPPTSWVRKSWAWHPSNETLQAKSMLRRYISDLRAGLDHSSFFMVTDFTSSYVKGDGNGMSDEAVWGIFENKEGYRPKKVFYVMRNFCTMFSNKTKLANYAFTLDLNKIYPVQSPVSRLGLLATLSNLTSFERNGHPVFCYYTPEDPQMQMTTIEDIALQIRSTKYLENPVLIDMMSGKVYRIKQSTASNISGIPLTDYPLFITDIAAISDIFVPKK